jgi:hypothetical protein
MASKTSKTKKLTGSPVVSRKPWFKLDDDEVHVGAWKFANDLYTKQSDDRRERAEDCLALYEGVASRQLGLLASTAWGMDPATFNAIGSVVDTRASHVFQNKVRPFFLTQKGNWEERERAQAMQQAVEGLFHENGIYADLGQHVCWDGETSDAGSREGDAGLREQARADRARARARRVRGQARRPARVPEELGAHHDDRPS